MPSDTYSTKVIVRPNAASLWRDATAYVFYAGERVKSVSSKTSPSLGLETIESRGVKLVLTNPRARFIISDVRPLVPAFCIGNFLYFLSGSDEVGPLQYYNPLALKFSDDGHHLHGAYAPRLIGQIDHLMTLLKNDPSSRRGVTLVMDPVKDHRESKDIPCPIAFQFLVRNDQLEMHVMFRSQNVAMVFPYDIFLFTLIQEYLAVGLELGLGAYVQYATSLHYYDREIALVEGILAENPRSFTMPAMLPLPSYTELMGIERAYRNYGSQLQTQTPDESSLFDDPYWSGILRILMLTAEDRIQGIGPSRDPGILTSAWNEMID